MHENLSLHKILLLLHDKFIHDMSSAKEIKFMHGKKHDKESLEMAATDLYEEVLKLYNTYARDVREEAKYFDFINS